MSLANEGMSEDSSREGCGPLTGEGRKGEFFVLIGKLTCLDLSMQSGAGDPLGKVAPIIVCQRACFAVGTGCHYVAAVIP